MSTLFTKIYDKFEGIVEDPDFNTLTTDQRRDMEYLMLDEASTMRFRECRTDLSQRVDDMFVETLTPEEEWILATYMKLIWHERPLSFMDTLEEKIGLRDFKSWDPNKRAYMLKNIKDDILGLAKNYSRNYDWGTHDDFEW